MSVDGIPLHAPPPAPTTSAPAPPPVAARATDEAVPLSTRTGGVFNRYFIILLPLLIGVTYVILDSLGILGLPPVILLWLLLLPLLLSPLYSILWREGIGVAFLFLAISNADIVDTATGSEGNSAVYFLLLGGLYLVQRWRDALRAAQHPLSLLVLLFLAQEVLSAVAFGKDPHFDIGKTRCAVYVGYLAVVVMMGRPRGHLLVPAVSILAILISVPFMMQELSNPDEFHLSSSILAGVSRGGGLFAQANNAGIALNYALGYVLAFAFLRRLSRGCLLVLVASIVIGILYTASRGALVTAMALLAVYWLHVSRRSFAPAMGALGVVGSMVLLIPDALRAAVDAAAEQLESLGLHQISRLGEIVDALSGKTDSLMQDDVRDGRVAAALQGLDAGLENPLFGVGTGNFVTTMGYRSHFQLAEIFAQNGLFGLGLYLALLVSALRAGLRLSTALRWPAFIILLPWLLSHLHSHNIVEYKWMMAPLGIFCGFVVRAHEGAIDAPAAPAR